MKQTVFMILMLSSLLMVGQERAPVQAQPDSTLKAYKDSLQHIVTYHKNGGINEDYYKSSNGDKIGSYKRYTRYGKLYITGKYNEGMPAGVWYYYSADTSGKLVQALDFDKHKELYVDSLRVPQLFCGPRFFGGNMIQMDYIQKRLRTDFTAEEREKYKGQSFTVSYTVDATTLKPILITPDQTYLSPDMAKRFIQIVKDMPAYLPPVCRPGSEPVWRTNVVFYFP